MSKEFVFILMIFCHIVDDYYLQGILAQMKQKSWWKSNAPQELYKHDYVVALMMHGFSWAFMIMLPIALYMSFSLSMLFCTLFIANILVHCFVDTMKANAKKINLIVDQLIHIVQIILTYAMLMLR